MTRITVRVTHGQPDARDTSRMTGREKQFARTAAPRLHVGVERMSVVGENSILLIRENKLLNPPDNLNAVEAEDLQTVLGVFLGISGFVKNTTRLENGLDIFTSFYKAHCQGFKERVRFAEMAKIFAINLELGWHCVRDLYFEAENGRLVVEINKFAYKSSHPALGADPGSLRASVSTGMPPPPPRFPPAMPPYDGSKKRRRNDSGVDRPIPPFVDYRQPTTRAPEHSPVTLRAVGTLQKVVNYMLPESDEEDEDDRFMV